MPIDFADEELAELERRGLLRRLRAVDGAQGRAIRVDGRLVVSFSSNDYLGLAAHPELGQAAAAAAEAHGSGAGASRLIAGNLGPHRRLEAALADFFGAPAALLFNSGYQANVGVLQALAGRGDAIYSDELNHASIIDGCRLSRAAVHVYPHRDVAALAKILAETGPSARRRFIVSDTLFSMDGDRAPVAALAEVAAAHGAALILDEAHAVGVIGPGGRGVAAEAGVSADVVVGTLGKAFGSFGAFVLGRPEVVTLLVNRARSFVFTTGLPPAVAAASEAALRVAGETEGERRRAHLMKLVHELYAALRSRHLIAQLSDISQIFPIIVGEEAAAMQCSEALLEAGIYVQGIRPPTVPAGTARLRIALSATHMAEDVERLLAALDDLVAAGRLPTRRSS